MTSEERAAKAHYEDGHGGCSPACGVEIAAVAWAIDAAVAAEREACAKVLDDVVAEHRAQNAARMAEMNVRFRDRTYSSCETGAFCEDYGCHSLLEIAAAIRARIP